MLECSSRTALSWLKAPKACTLQQRNCIHAYKVSRLHIVVQITLLDCSVLPLTCCVTADTLSIYSTCTTSVCSLGHTEVVFPAILACPEVERSGFWKHRVDWRSGKSCIIFVQMLLNVLKHWRLFSFFLSSFLPPLLLSTWLPNSGRCIGASVGVHIF